MPRKKCRSIMRSGYGDYDVDINLSKEPIKIKKIKLPKKRDNMRVLSTGIGDYDLELNFGKDPLRIRNIKKQKFK